MAQKNVTLSLNEHTYEAYKKFCKKNGMALSRKIELFMEEEIEKMKGIENER